MAAARTAAAAAASTRVRRGPGVVVVQLSRALGVGLDEVLGAATPPASQGPPNLHAWAWGVT